MRLLKNLLRFPVAFFRALLGPIKRLCEEGLGDTPDKALKEKFQRIDPEPPATHAVTPTSHADSGVVCSTSPAPTPHTVAIPVPVESPLEVAFDPSTLSCEKHEVSVDASIDYVDKRGNATRRDITTEEIYDYEDGVVVIRAYCHRTKDYRTFISSRIKYWVDSSSGKPIPLQNLANYLVRASQLDPTNIALNIPSTSMPEVLVFIHTAGKYTQNTYTSRNGLTYYKVSLSLVNALVGYLLGLPRSRMLTESLNAGQIDEVKDILRCNLQDCKVTDAQVFLAKKILRESELWRRKNLVEFAQIALEGMPAQSSVVQLLDDELLDPSFRIPTPQPLINLEENTKQQEELNEYLLKLTAEKQQTIADIRSESDEAEKEVEDTLNAELPRSKSRVRKHRKSTELNLIRNLARQECHTQLMKNLQEGTLIFERGPFEQEIRKRVCSLLTEQELLRYGDMLLPYLGNGIQFGYLVTGLKKKNRGWYPNESGKVVIDLNNIRED